MPGSRGTLGIRILVRMVVRVFRVGFDEIRASLLGLQSQNRALSSLVLRLQRRGQFDDRFKFGREGIKTLEQVIEDARL